MPAHGSNERQQEPDDGAKPANALLQLEHLGLEPNVVHVDHVAAHYGPVVTPEPTRRRGTGHPECSDNVHVSSGADEVSKPVVVRALWSLL